MEGVGFTNSSEVGRRLGRKNRGMSNSTGSGLEFVELLRKKDPEYVALITAESEQAFDDAFDVLLEKAVASLERDKNLFIGLNEDGLSAVLGRSLMVPGFTVTRQTYSGGHVDLTIELQYGYPMRRKLAEAKIYDGPAYHVKGMEQLHGRYTTGREGRGLVIEYVRTAGIAKLFEKLREKLDADLPVKQKGPTKKHPMKWAFISVHEHSCGDDLEIGHIGCNLYIEQSKSGDSVSSQD
jgi:hypothetical protein